MFHKQCGGCNLYHWIATSEVCGQTMKNATQFEETESEFEATKHENGKFLIVSLL